MADADEDAILSNSNRDSLTSHLSGTQDDDDYEDEGNIDFRFLAALSNSTGGASGVLPKRGTKDFEPNPTKSQASALDASREAMHNALSVVRVHTIRNCTVGQYLSQEEEWDGQETYKHKASGAGGTMKAGEGRCVVVETFRGTMGKTLGVNDRSNWTWLLPEEALFLLERGSLDIRWPDIDGEEELRVEHDRHTGQNTEAQEKQVGLSLDQEHDVKLPSTVDEDEVEEEQLPTFKLGTLPMSLQGGYASLVGKSSLSLERYIVYAGLKRIGYIVQRAPTWDEDNDLNEDDPRSELSSPTQRTSSTNFSNAGSFVHRLVSWLVTPHKKEGFPATGPLISLGIYRDYSDVFRSLALVPDHKPPSHIASLSADSSIQQLTRRTKLPFRVAFHVWKPSTTTWRKTAPPPPDFRVAVIDARTTHVPTLDEIGTLLDSMPEDELPREKRLEMRLKHGNRNVILAIVDSGLVSYLRFSDAMFGEHKLYEEKRGVGTKGKRGGGRGGYRGRGGGRGRGRGTG